MLLVAHETFLKQYKAVVSDYPAIKKSLNKQLEKAAADPFNAGEQLRDIADERLRQKLLKVWVRGEQEPTKKGHRLLYMVRTESRAVFPFFISPRPRAQFSYDEYDWESLAHQIYEDLINGRIEKFVRFEPWRQQDDL